MRVRAKILDSSGWIVHDKPFGSCARPCVGTSLNLLAYLEAAVSGATVGVDALTSKTKGGTSEANWYPGFGHTPVHAAQQLVAADVRLVASLLTGRG